MWVERATATELYVKHPHESPDDSSVIDEAWDRRMRRADDGTTHTIHSLFPIFFSLTYERGFPVTFVTIALNSFMFVTRWAKHRMGLLDWSISSG